MHLSSNLSHNTAGYGLQRIGGSLALLLLGCWGVTLLARGLPDFFQRIAAPCAGCYFGAFGPPLAPYGRPARLDDVNSGPPPAALTVRTELGLTGTIRDDLSGIADLLAAKPDFVSGEIWDASPAGIVSDHRLDIASLSRAAAMPSIAGWPESDAAKTELHQGETVAGLVPATGAPPPQGVSPHWRVAVQKDLERHFLQIANYETDTGMAAAGGHPSAGTDVFSDKGADASYQFIVDPGSADSDRLSVHATLIHETRSLGAGNRTLGSNAFDTLDTFRANASWSIGDTITPSIQYFRTAGSIEAVPYAWPSGRPNSAGVIAEVAYVPWSWSQSPIQFLNLRFAAQYVAYTELNGTGRGVAGNNAVNVSLWGALRF
jgi:hypothetical protein